MSDTTKVRFGLQSARELEFEVEDADAVAKAIEKGKADGTIVWVVDAKGHRHGLDVAKLAFMEIEAAEEAGGVGFSSG